MIPTMPAHRSTHALLRCIFPRFVVVRTRTQGRSVSTGRRRRPSSGESPEHGAVPDGEPTGIAEGAHPGGGATGGEKARDGIPAQIEDLSVDPGLEPAQGEGRIGSGTYPYVNGPERRDERADPLG